MRTDSDPFKAISAEAAGLVQGRLAEETAVSTLLSTRHSAVRETCTDSLREADAPIKRVPMFVCRDGRAKPAVADFQKILWGKIDIQAVRTRPVRKEPVAPFTQGRLLIAYYLPPIDVAPRA